MKTRPIVPACIDWADDGTPLAPQFGDVYHPRIGAAAQARHVFLDGNDLPPRWAGRPRFTVFETGFGLGHNFMATWQALRDDPQAPRCLHYLAVEAHPPTRQDLQRAHAHSDTPELPDALIAAWPPLVPGIHHLHFEGGALRLALALGDVRDLLPEWLFDADAFFLDGFAPDRNPAMWDRRVLRALGRRAAPNATAATWSVAREVRDGLTAAGFDLHRRDGIGGKRQVLQARFAPRAPTRPWADAAPEGPVLVLGAGLAGACTAAALAAQGCEVCVVDRHAEPAGGSSGNPAGLFHATVHGDDSPYARLFRAAALRAVQVIRACGAPQVPQATDGLLRLERDRSLAQMQAMVATLALPADLVRVLDADEASALAGQRLASPAWFYPQGGWVSPSHLVRALLDRPGIQFRGRVDVQTLQRVDGRWRCLDAQGRTAAEAGHVVLAAAEQVNPWLADLGWAPLPCTRSRGQVTVLPPTAGLPALHHPVAGDGYVLPLPDGRLLCGATTGADEGDDRPRESDHLANLQRLQRLLGQPMPSATSDLTGRVGWRVQTVDRLPVVGPMPLRHFEPGTRLDQARLVPREPGLHVATAFGARGITLAPLMGECLAARITGAPMPLEQSLVDLVDPARWVVRAARQSGG